MQVKRKWGSQKDTPKCGHWLLKRLNNGLS